MRRLLALFSAALAIVLLLEGVFAAGVWEPMASPTSHAGTSVRLKRALSDPTLPHIDYVTLGSSRPEYGIDHRALADAAADTGLVHANLSMPGSHWMTIGILSRWLERTHPEIRGGIIALSIQDLMFPGNGDYEVGIVYPFRSLTDVPWINQHVPVTAGDVASYATVSALFGWRSDIRDFVQHPFARTASIDWFKDHRGTHVTLFEDPESTGDMCAWGVDSLDACARIDGAAAASVDGLRNQCREIRSRAARRTDFTAAMQQGPLPDFMQRTRDLVQGQLRAMRWPTPPLVVLMPMPRIWQRDVTGPGLHDWALSILQPLVAEGRITLFDATGFFDADADAGCSSFFDFYHQNASGRDRLMRSLLPRVQESIYRRSLRATPSRPPHRPAIRP